MVEQIQDHEGGEAPDALALEEIYSHYAYPNTAVLMGHARGVVCLAASQKGILVFNYASTKVKHALAGSGRATKMQVQKAIMSRLNLSKIPPATTKSPANIIKMVDN